MKLIVNVMVEVEVFDIEGEDVFDRVEGEIMDTLRSSLIVDKVDVQDIYTI